MPASRPAESCLQVALPSREPVLAGGRGGLRGARRYHGPCLVQQHGPTPRPSYLRLVAHARPCDVARPKLSHNVTTGAQEVGGWLRILYPQYQLVVGGGGYKVWISPSWRSTRKQTAVRQFVSKREFYVLVDLPPTVGPTNPTFHSFVTLFISFTTTCKILFSRFVFLTLTFGFNISSSNSDPNADLWSRIHIRFYHSSRNNSYSSVPVSFSQISLCKMF